MSFNVRGVTSSSSTFVKLDVSYVNGSDSGSYPFTALKKLNFYFAPAGPQGSDGASMLTADLVTLPQGPNVSLPSTTTSYGNIDGLYFDTVRKTLIFRTNTGFVELIAASSDGAPVSFTPTSSTDYPNN